MASLWQYLEQPETAKHANVAGPSPEPPPANNMASHQGMEPGSVPPPEFMSDANATTPMLSEADQEKQAEALGLMAADSVKIAADLIDVQQEEAQEVAAIEDALIKIAELDDETFNAHYGEYATLGRNTGMGMIGAYVKAAMDVSAVEDEYADPYLYQIKEAVAEATAQELSMMVPPEALQDPDAVQDIINAADAAAVMRVNQMAEDASKEAGRLGDAAKWIHNKAEDLGEYIRPGDSTSKTRIGSLSRKGTKKHDAYLRDQRINRAIGYGAAGLGTAGVAGAGYGAARMMGGQKKAGLGSMIGSAAKKVHEGAIGLGAKLRPGVKRETDLGQYPAAEVAGMNAQEKADALSDIATNRRIAATLGYGAPAVAVGATAAGAKSILGGNNAQPQ